MTKSPGWYERPEDSSGAQHWWDGNAWTGEAWQPPVHSPSAAVESLPPAVVLPPRRRGVRLWLVALLGIALLAFGYSSHRTGELERIREYQRTTFVEILIQEPSRTLAVDTLVEAEAGATDFEPQPDANGAYLDSAQTLARMFGLELRWGHAAEPGQCEIQDIEPAYVVAWYCERESYLITLNRDAIVMPQHLYEEGLIDTVKYVLAQHLIHARCGTVDPRAVNDVHAGVTNSYAVRYLGADRDELEKAVADGFSEYTMSGETDAIAARLHAGDCR